MSKSEDDIKTELAEARVRITELEAIVSGQAKTIKDLETRCKRQQDGIQRLTDERDIARAETNTMRAKLSDANRRAARPSAVGSSEMQGLGSLEEAIRIASEGQHV
jgi:chromosome segregation ATPase